MNVVGDSTSAKKNINLIPPSIPSDHNSLLQFLPLEKRLLLRKCPVYPSLQTLRSDLYPLLCLMIVAGFSLRI
jgi:hypothetical protein